MRTQRVYNGRDNKIDLALRQDGQPVSATILTRVQFEMHPKDGGSEVVIDSNTSPNAFDLTQVKKVGDVVVNIVRLILGDESIPAGHYDGWLVGFDADHTDGLVWAEFPVWVKD